MSDYTAGYVKLEQSGELEQRSSQLKKRLGDCIICPHRCGVKRLKGRRGFCKAGEEIVISSYGPHWGEEDVLVGTGGSGTIFFSNCTLRCVFCQNSEISHGGEGYEVTPAQLAEIMLALQRKWCHNINLVSPSHFVPQIVEAICIAAKKGLTLPVVYNTGGYDEAETLKLLDGIIDIYMPDIKFGSNNRALQYTNASAYFDIVKAAVKEMHRQVGDLVLDDRGIAYHGLLVRHLVMPDDLADSAKVFEFIANEVSRDTFVNVMEQYHPAYRAGAFPALARRISREEYDKAVTAAEQAGLRRLC